MKILVASLSSEGFLYPSMYLGKQLKHAGHEIRFVTDISREKLLCDEGLHRIQRTSKDGPSFDTKTWFDPVAVALQTLHVKYAIEQFEPDLVVGQTLTLGPRIAAEIADLPIAIIGMLAFLFPSQNDRSLATPGAVRRCWREADMLARYNQARCSQGLDPKESTPSDNGLVGDLYMVRSVRQLVTDLDSLPPTVHLVGPCSWREAEDLELKQMLDAVTPKTPIIYVQHGRVFGNGGFWQTLMIAVEGLNVFIVASTGRSDVPIGYTPSNVYAKPHLPQDQVLPRAALVIANGNTTAVSGALSAGVPLCLFPQGGEQPDLAELCTSLGVAKTPDLEAMKTPDLMRREIMDILEDKSLKEQCQTVAGRIDQDRESSRSAVSLIEQLGRTRCPVTR